MHRRKFLQQGLMASASAMILQEKIFKKKTAYSSDKKPAGLKQGDVVGIVTPASPFSEAQFKRATDNIESLGFRVKLAKNLHARKGFLAGTDQQRLDDLHAFFTDKEVKAIWCLRGGYGSARLLPYIKYSIIRKNPKILIGYSDITALLNAIYQQTGLICFHGPVAAADFSDFATKNLRPILCSPLPTCPPFEFSKHATLAHETLRGGKARGKLVGGNLSLVAALCGTPFQIDVNEKILFLEDVDEKPYRIDRMLTQIKQSCRLEKAAGIVLGVFSNCEPDKDTPSLSLDEVLHEQLTPLGIPVFKNAPFGHIKDQITLPVGAMAELDADAGEWRLVDEWLQGN